MRWFVDGNNVMGAGADGWWNDPVRAAAAVAQAVARWSNDRSDPVVLVFDGRAAEQVAAAAGGNLEVAFARRAGRDAADDLIVELVEAAYADEPDLVVATSDKGLVARLPPGVDHEGAGAFRRRIGLPDRPRRPRHP